MAGCVYGDETDEWVVVYSLSYSSSRPSPSPEDRLDASEDEASEYSLPESSSPEDDEELESEDAEPS